MCNRNIVVKENLRIKEIDASVINDEFILPCSVPSDYCGIG